MSSTPLFDALLEYRNLSKGYYRIPGHRFERGVPEKFLDFAGPGIFRLDVTETPLSDDLHNPGTVIRESQNLTAQAFGADRSFYLVNGTTCGNQSMIMAAAGEGKKILVPRNAHKSVLSGLILSGADPVYMPVEYISDLGLPGILKTETLSEALSENPDTGAVFAVSPNYHGLCSEISGLAGKAHALGIPLLVDEAHGSHFYFSKLFPAGALEQGADVCAQSLHKTAGALTQASLLHIKSRLIDPDRLDKALRMTMSTSPSYLLLVSLELALEELERRGGELLEYTAERAGNLKKRINRIPGFISPGEEAFRKAGITESDPARITLDCGRSGLNGFQLKKLLWEEYGIDTEMADYRNLLLILGWGNTDEESDNLIKALKDLSSRHKIPSLAEPGNSGAEMNFPAIPPKVLTPRQAWSAETRTVPWNEMKGKVSAETVAPYPPGIPVLCPGEKITGEIYDFLQQIKKDGLHLHGPGDGSLATFRICD